MTVKELIKELKQYDKDAPVWSSSNTQTENGYPMETDKITVHVRHGRVFVEGK
jgi:hypothetical protein